MKASWELTLNFINSKGRRFKEKDMESNKGHIFYTSIADSIKRNKSKEYVIRSKCSDESYDPLGKD